MKTIGLLILGIMLMGSAVVGQSVPQDVDSATIQVINQEHKNTRKFFSDELTRQRTEFNKDFVDRAEYYQKEADDLITTAVWKLGLMWAGIVFLVFGLNSFLSIKLEKRKWNKMLESAKAEIMADVNQKAKEKENQIIQAQNMVSQQESALNQKQAEVDQKMDYLKRTRPQLVAMQQKIAQQQAELQEVMKKTQLFEA